MSLDLALGKPDAFLTVVTAAPDTRLTPLLRDTETGNF